MKIWRPTLLMAILLAIVLTRAVPVNAHGSGQTAEIYLVPVGPYYLSVWSSPGILRTGEVHFATAVKDSASTAVLDCTVTITLTPLDGAGDAIKMVTRAPTELTNFEHEIEQVIKEPGRYNIEVDVVDPAGDGGSAEFEIEIVSLPGWIKAYVYFAASFTSIAGLMLIKRGFVLFGLWKPKKIKRPVTRPMRRSN